MKFNLTPGGAPKRRRVSSKITRHDDGGMYALIQIRSFGDALRFHRFRLNLSQKEFCDLVKKKTGQNLSPSAISQWENGQVDPTWTSACIIADTLGVKLDDLKPDARTMRPEERI